MNERLGLRYLRFRDTSGWYHIRSERKGEKERPQRLISPLFSAFDSTTSAVGYLTPGEMNCCSGAIGTHTNGKYHRVRV